MTGGAACAISGNARIQVGARQDEDVVVGIDADAAELARDPALGQLLRPETDRPRTAGRLSRPARARAYLMGSRRAEQGPVMQ